jgi:hypothetical protein
LTSAERTLRRATLATLALLACLALFAGSAAAATFVVDDASDGASPNACTAAPADCTLRGAIDKANAQVGDDTLDVAVPGLTVDGPLPEITERLTIDGNGAPLAGSASYAGLCAPDLFALRATAAVLTRSAFPIRSVCGRAVQSTPDAPTIQVGPRRADNSVPISGFAAVGSVELYRADPPAVSGEGAAAFAGGIASTGSYSYLPPAEPSAGERFSATVTDAGGATSTFSQAAATPNDLTSPNLLRAVVLSNETVRLDFDEPISGAVNGLTNAFKLSIGGTRQITNVGVDGSSVYLVSVSMPWKAGETGSVSFTGAGRVIDLAGNELLERPEMQLAAGPGELTLPTITKLRVSPSKFCQKKTRRCTKRRSSYITMNLSKSSRVVFTIRRASNRRFVVRYVRRIQAGYYKSRITGKVNGRWLPATSLTIDAQAEDVARNLSTEVSAPFRVAWRNSQF